ncbi:MAG: 2'-5' RNA ligase family protein [Pseudonocardiaceae bacterium]
MAATPCPENAESAVHALVAFLDDPADQEIRALWQVLQKAGVPSGGRRFPPHVPFGAAASMPARARAAVREELALLTLPGIWLSTLATFPNTDNVLMLTAVVDTELLAVHSAVHDALAGKVRHPSVLHLPGSWVPHCTLAERITPTQLATGFALLHPVAPIRATLGPVVVLDTGTGTVEPLRQR